MLWITLLLDDPSEGPPTNAGAQQWKQQYGLTNSGVFPDSQFTFVPGNSVGTPQLTIIDPRTMEVKLVHEGLTMDDYAMLRQVAQANKALWGN